jgi:hypothetical protein
VDDQQIRAEGAPKETDGATFRRRHGAKKYALLDESEDRISYAPKSDAEDLGRYAGRYVRLSGFPVEGYPVEAKEPGYISVTRVD